MARPDSLPVRAFTGPLLAAAAPVLAPLRARLRGPGAEYDAVLARAEATGLQTVALFAGPRPGPDCPAHAPRLVLVHEPAPPERRATFLREQPSHPAPGLLALSTREWEVWSGGGSGRLIDPTTPLRGAPLSALPEDEEQGRRRRLRRAAELAWTDLPAALGSRKDPVAASLLAADLRGRCARETSPTRFPPIPGADASLDLIAAAALGVVHATFGGEGAPDPGDALPLDADDRPPSPLRDPLRALLGPLLLDLPQHARADLLALYVAPGPFGTLHDHRLLALVADDAPLHRAAALRRRLDAHLQLLAPGWVGVALPCPHPVVLTVAALRGLLVRRLFPRPLQRLALRLHADLLWGEDVLPQLVAGIDHSDADRRIEVAALLDATAAAFRPGATASSVFDLLFGAWPATLHVLGGGDPRLPLATVHEDLARRTDPALARVGSAALRAPWGSVEAADRGRAAPVLAAWGPALLRLAEVALEVLR